MFFKEIIAIYTENHTKPQIHAVGKILSPLHLTYWEPRSQVSVVAVVLLPHAWAVLDVDVFPS
jgi:hypothetical protein